MKEFSTILKFERKFNGYSQAEFAGMLGLSHRVYACYENEKLCREPPFEIVCKIAKLLDVSVDYLFGLED